MTCFSPVQGFERKGITPNGKFLFTYNPEFARRVNGVPVPRVTNCRKCEGCRFAHSKEWAVKLFHEARMNFDGTSFNNSFITLTYNDDHIPLYGSLDYADHWTNFLKRFRKAIAPTQIRYFMVGEYGDLNLRPHYHAIIFGYSFPDRVYLSNTDNSILYRSSLLESLWTVPRGQPGAGASRGYSSIGDVSFGSAAYVARYNMKKTIGFDKHELLTTYDEETGELIPGRYQRVNQITGDIITVERERHLMSKGGRTGNGGIGKSWFNAFAMTDIYVKGVDGIYKDHTHNDKGMIIKPASYYDKLLERVDPLILEEIKKQRQDYRLSHADEFTPDLLRQRRECMLGKLKVLKRNIRNVYR